jgi:ATP-dependent exoDNAse (exonuclease V) beta subunit
MAQLSVYKASAGSGKTFRLSIEYLKLLLRNPESYRHILGVTFTNKATAEMKERVLGALEEAMYLDPQAEPKGMTEVLCRELGYTPAQIRDRATLAMGFLLHDYGRFRIETIDGFFQSVLRNLARELGLGAWLNIELNNKGVLSDAVDALVDGADQYPERLQWLKDYMEELLQEGKSWKVERELKSFGSAIFSEAFKEKEAILTHKLTDKHFLRDYKKRLREVEQSHLQKLQQQAERFFQILGEQGLTVSDFSRGATGPCSYFLKLQKGLCEEAIYTQRYVQDALEDPSKWATKTSSKKAQIEALSGAVLNPLLQETERLRSASWPLLCTARLAGRHLNQIGLLTDIAAEVQEANAENNRFLLSNTNALLKSLLKDSDASFVYEKTGSELNHILFDEFQDTSRMQWDTFKPLLAEGLANGYNSLIVGDEKQSIYRFRNGDWRILGNIEREMPAVSVAVHSLTSNWRSRQRLVQFNNTLFAALEKRVNELHRETFGTGSTELEHAYADVQQHAERKGAHGRVEIAFLTTPRTETYRTAVLKRLVQQTEALQRDGMRPECITILIRRNAEVPEIGQYFADYKVSEQADPSLCYDVVSDEAFLLKSSKALQVLIDALRLLHDPTDPIAQAQLKLDYQTDVLGKASLGHDVFLQRKTAQVQPSAKTVYQKVFVDSNPDLHLLPAGFTERFEALQRLPLYELVEELYRLFDLRVISSQDNYLHCFMDKLSEYLLRAPADLSAFLQYWEDEMGTVSIPSGSAVNGIRILSIHKSKGLEFHTVLIPFCDWSLLTGGPSGHRVWCSPDRAPFNELDLLPIDYGEEMKQSFFREDFAEETLQLRVDALNLLYVAFTRAKNNLYVYGRGNERAEQKDPKTVADLQEEALRSDAFLGEDARFIPSVDTEEADEELSESRFESGICSVEPDPKSSTQGIDLPLPFRSFPHKTSFRQSNRSREFCRGNDNEETTSSYIDRGKLLHRLFQEIHTKDDVDKALHALTHEGILTSEEADRYGAYTREALEQPGVSDWYSGRFRLFNECSILSKGPDGKSVLKRPDRVMVDPEGVQVVDFKFGKGADSHRRQVQAYMHLLGEMGYVNVKGYLWYVDEARVEAVTH